MVASLATTGRPMSIEDEQGLVEGSLISDEYLWPWAVGRRHDRHAMETFFDLESRSSLSSMSLARASNYTLASATNSTTTNFIYTPATFLVSRSTSAATAMTKGTTALSAGTGSVQYHNWLQPEHRRRSRQPKLPALGLLEPDIEDEDDYGTVVSDETNKWNEDRAGKLSALLGEYGYRLAPSRPSSSRSHLQPVDRTFATLDANTRASSDGSSLPPMSNVTREEFEALPPTIQRKYFSTLERLRFAQHSSIARHPDPAGNELGEQTSAAPLPPRPAHQARLHTDSALAVGRSRPQVVNPTEQAFYNSLPDKIKRRHLNEEEQLAAHFHRQAVLLDAADQACMKLGKRRSEQALNSTIDRSNEPALSEHYFSDMPSIEEQTPRVVDDKPATGSLYDSFRWLEEDDDLDLRLFLDDYHINLREDMPRPSNKSRRPSFRRHLSISKLPFGRSSVSFQNSRPGTKDTVTSPMSTGHSPSSAPGTPGHLRKKSRALSLISPNKQSAPDSSAAFDPAASHYQDPEARAKLRVYLGSPQKFDEAIEFGFPSIDEDGPGARTLKRAESRQGFLGEWDHDLGTFLEDDDDKSSILSDDVTATEPESPKTPPETYEKPLPMRPLRLSSEPVVSKGDYAQSSATSREMTLRMTLTRPDLRANEDHIYGWQKQTVRKSIMREGAVSPVIFTREVSNPKASIEKQFAMMDQENLMQDGGVVKRFWNRVRRS